MSIDDEHGEWESPVDKLQLFTDRYEFTRLFATYLNDSPPRKTILFLHGDGGNGKSLLLKFMREKCCKCFAAETWEQLKARSNVEVANYIQNATDWDGVTLVPSILLDFGQSARGEDQPQDPFYGLLMLRRSLATAASELGYQLKFPLYDFACVWHLHKKGKSPEEITRLFPFNEIAGLIVPFIDLATANPIGTIGKAVFDIFAQDLGEKFTLYLQQRGLEVEQVENIRRRNPDTELIDELPKLLAKDLNAAMLQDKAPPRLVLFFDAHEAFWGYQRNLPEEKFFYLDEWLRRLLRALDLEAGIVAVVAGREKPRWTEVAKSPIPPNYLDTQLVWHLSTSDARSYLQKAGISDEALAEGLISYASVAPEQVHPFYLGLCADVVLTAAKRNISLSTADFAGSPEAADKSRELINRLLCYVEDDVKDAVHALSACRTFNRELYFHLSQVLHFHATAASFRILTRFSFVWQAHSRGENWYRIHDLLRRLDYERGNVTTRNAHTVLEQYYREQGNVAETIYHLNRFDWERGVNEWVEAFDRALQLSRFEECRTLLEVRSELLIHSDFQWGSVSQSEGDYFIELARHAEAKQEYLEAIAAYDSALTFAPDNTYVLNNKGFALLSRGDVQTQLAQYQVALQSYTDAITIYNSALTLAPNYVIALNNKGKALLNLGILQAELSQEQEAIKNCQAALKTFSHSLQIVPSDEYICNLRDRLQEFLGNLGDGENTEFMRLSVAKGWTLYFIYFLAFNLLFLLLLKFLTNP